MERRKTQREVRKVDIPAVVAGEGELEPIKTTEKRSGPATQRKDRLRGQLGRSKFLFYSGAAGGWSRLL